MADSDDVLQAIRDSWALETSSDPDDWSLENPARGQCDASSFVAWQYLGGDLVLGKVFTDGAHTEHHYWNRVDGEDVDLTRDQFKAGEEIVEERVVPHDFLVENMGTMKPETLDRVNDMRERVAAKLGEQPTRP